MTKFVPVIVAKLLDASNLLRGTPTVSLRHGNIGMRRRVLDVLEVGAGLRRLGDPASPRIHVADFLGDAGFGSD